MERSSAAWEPPSEPVGRLIKEFAEATLQDPSPLFEVVDRAVLRSAPERLLDEPALSTAMREANHANLRHWMAANAAAPGARVPANVGQQTLELARDIVRRGFDDASLNAYRVGQNAALRFLMSQVFDVSDDVAVIRELLDVTSRSIFTFVDDTLEGIEGQIGVEREALERGTHAERLAGVNLILEGAPISVERASSRLGYELDSPQQAAVVWAASAVEAGALEGAADQLARQAGAARPFTVAASARSLWAWYRPGAMGDSAGAEAPDLGLGDGVRVAVGSVDRGLEGFRRSHFNALATQGLMQRAGNPVAIATYADVEPVAIAAADEAGALEFASRTLGDLATGDVVLRDTVLAYIRADLNASAAARGLFAHRNTVLNRLERAGELLSGDLDGRAVEVGLALEIVRWLGAPQTGARTIGA